MREAQELRQPTEQYFAQPLEDNLFEWHFTIRGPADTAFSRGIYHGRIVLPPDYPMKPPSIILLTPNGRFEINKKICLSISGHHPESWQPSWSIRTALLAIIGFMPTHGSGAIGSLDYTPEERKVLASKSLDWKCPQCGKVTETLLPVTEASKETTKEAEELASQIAFQGHVAMHISYFQGEKDKSVVDSKDKSSPPPANASQTPLSATTVTSPTTATPATSMMSPAAATNSPPIAPTSAFAYMQRFNPHMYPMPFPGPRFVPPAFPGARSNGPNVTRQPPRWPTQFPGAVPRGNVMYWSYNSNPLRHPTNTTAVTTPSSNSAGTTAGTTAQASSTVTSQTTTTPNTVPDSGLRRRHVTTLHANEPAELASSRSTHSGDRVLLLLTVIVGLLLAALILRRLLKIANVL
ncbi:hypothetical protein NP493_2012g00018 [Ridgeia piscesae]|uniref:UBC core domain-containing protein n=1 Tax=Ridgeia piscesae TaxID=27915 RepID=A0AAD9JNJ5_RIDPI|nr:hypothetical protein NP493_2012g00018 [Ridgeia piscesae]